MRRAPVCAVPLRCIGGFGCGLGVTPRRRSRALCGGCGGVLGGQSVQYAAAVFGGDGLLPKGLELFLGHAVRAADTVDINWSRIIKMDLKQVNEEVEKINSYLRNCLWMDFEVCQMSFIKVEVAGRMDISSNKYAISIEFEQPHFISGLLCWSLDNSKDFISIASPSEFSEYNKKFRIDNGKHLFKIYMEGFDEPFYIAASAIKSTILIPH